MAQPRERLEHLLELVRSERLDETNVLQMFSASFVEKLGAETVVRRMLDLISPLDLDALKVTDSNELFIRAEVPHRDGGALAIAVSVDDRGAVAAVQSAAVPEPLREINSISELPALVKESGIVGGLSFASIRDGRIDDVLVTGGADGVRKTAVTESSLFQAGSISKPVAALTALRLVDEGLIGLDDDISPFLKSWSIPSVDGWVPRVSLRALLTHTAGFSVWGFPGYAEGERVPSLLDVLRGAGNTPPIRPEAVPGLAWRYSGGGYTVMQQLLIDVCDEPFPALVRRLVLDPLGMSDSSFDQPLPDDRAAQAVSGHRSGSPIPGRWHTYPELAAAGLWTTASDLARFALGGESLLSQPLAREFVQGCTAESGMGLGIMLEQRSDELIRAHAGGNSGFIADMAWTEAGRFGGVAMTNASDGYPLIHAAFRALGKERGFDDLPPPRRFLGRTSFIDAASRSVAEAAEEGDTPRVVEGVFAVHSDLFAEVEATGSAVTLRVGDQPALRLYPSAEKGWTARGLDVHLSFDDDPAQLLQRGRSFELTPVPSERRSS